MAKNNQNKKIVIGIIIGLIALFFLSQSNIFKLGELTAGADPSTSECGLVNKGSAVGSFPCDSGTLCTAKVSKFCDNLVGGGQRVVFRTSDINYREGWIALLDPFSSELIPYGAGSKSCPNRGYPGSSNELPFTAPPGLYEIGKRRDDIYVNKRLGGQFNCYRAYEPDEPEAQEANLDPNPIGDECGLTATCEGTAEAHICSEDIVVKDSSGNVIKTIPIGYNKPDPGKFFSDTIFLNPGHTLSFDGDIEWKVFDTTNFCVKDVCNTAKDGIIQCEQAGSCFTLGQTTPCDTNIGEVCLDSPTGAFCKTPFDINVIFLDELNNPITGVSKGSPINMEIRVANVENPITLTIELRTSSNIKVSGTQSLTRTINPTDSGIIKVDLTSGDGIGLAGTYFVYIFVDLGDGRNTELIQDFPLEIGTDFNLIVSALSEGGGSTLFNNKYVIITLLTFEGSSGDPDPVAPDLISIEAEMQGTTIFYTDEDLSVIGSSKFFYDVTGRSGQLKITATATKDNVEVSSDPRIRTFEITPAIIDIEFLDIDKLRDTGLGVKTFHFQTKDPQGEILDGVNVEVFVTSAGEARPNVKEPVDGVVFDSGQNWFEVTHDVDEDGGWRFEVRATKDGFETIPASTPLINIITEGGPQKQCSVDLNDCPVGQLCVDGKCKDVQKGSRVMIVVIVILSVIIVGAVVFILIKRKQKRFTGGVF